VRKVKVEDENGRREEGKESPAAGQAARQEGEAGAGRSGRRSARGKAGAAKATNRSTARLRERYVKEVLPALMKEFSLKNPMAAPKLDKIILNMGVGEATQNAKLIDPAVTEVTQITGQKPVVTKAKKSIAQFKVREGMPIGVMVTLRGDRMYEFFDRLVNVACRECAISAECRPSRLTGAVTSLWCARSVDLSGD